MLCVLKRLRWLSARHAAPTTHPSQASHPCSAGATAPVRVDLAVHGGARVEELVQVHVLAARRQGAGAGLKQHGKNKAGWMVGWLASQALLQQNTAHQLHA